MRGLRCSLAVALVGFSPDWTGYRRENNAKDQ